MNLKKTLKNDHKTNKNHTRKNKIKCFGEYIIYMLKSLNCKYVYGYQGGSITDFIDLIAKDKDLEYINCRSEGNAALSAFAEAKMKVNQENTISCCITTSGPGASNLLTGIIDSNLDRQRVIFITGSHNLFDISLGEFQNIKQEYIFESAGVRDSHFISNVENGVRILKNALSNSLKFYRPCHLAVPKDFFNKPIEKKINIDWNNHYLSEIFNDTELCNSIIDKVIKYNSSIVLGIGSLHLDKKLLGNLLSLLNLPIFFRTDGYRSYDIDEKLNYGIAGIYGENRLDLANKNLNDRELTLCIGVLDPSIHITNQYHNQDKKLIELNTVIKTESTHFKKEIYSMIGYKNNGFLNLMIKCVKNHKNFDKKLNILKTNYETKKQKIFTSKVKSFKNVIDKRYAKYPLSDKKNHCDTGILMSELSKYVKDGDTISVDTGEHHLWFGQFFNTDKDIRILTSEHMGTMGFGLCSSLAMSLNNPNKISFVIVGDGGFQFSLNELATIKQHGKGKIIIILINNTVLGRVKFYKSHTIQQGCDIFDPDFVKLAESYGGKGYLIEHNSDIPKIKEAIDSNNKICLINVMVDHKLRFFD
tara:strand:+ start:45 stop:1808 length:1764 start_codon:yes stop_codon:yes gene_type:complete